MSPVDRLPPPPAAPLRSPAVAVEGESPTRVGGLPGEPSLEARIAVPPAPVRGVVLCHPHPLYGGSMHSPVPLIIAKRLAEAAAAGGRAAWVRFNFRGVGSSEGAYDEGRGEVKDAVAAIDRLATDAGRVPVTMCGHSFGALVAYRAAALRAQVDRVLVISPSARLFQGWDAPSRPAARLAVFIGDRDELCDLEDVRALAARLGADLTVFSGYDHHFLKSRRALAEAALPVIAPEVVQGAAP